MPQRVEQPALMVTAGRDGVLLPALSAGLSPPPLTRFAFLQTSCYGRSI